MEYYEKYIGTVTISHYLDDEESINPSRASYQVTLHEAYPKGMSAIEVGWENAELQDFEIDMQYSWWTASGESKTKGQLGGNLAADQVITAGDTTGIG